MSDPVFFPLPEPVSTGQLAEMASAQLEGPGDTVVSAIAPLSRGGRGTLVFIEGRRNVDQLRWLKAAAILVTEDMADAVPEGIVRLVTPTPHLAFVRIAQKLFPGAVRPGPETGAAGISNAAHVDPTAQIEDGATIEAGAVVGPGAAIGAGTVVAPNAVIGPSCQIGRNCSIGANSSITHALIGDSVIIHQGVRIGQDGFGFVPGPDGLEKVPQIGRVIIQNHVEIGANSTVDRGAMDDTVIGEGTKIDNLVQVAHNVKIGRHCAIAAHCGISGSVTIGDGVLLGGRAGITDHIMIGDGAQIAAGSGIMNNVPPGERWGGAPAKPIKMYFRELAALKGLANPRKKDTGRD